MRDTFFHVYMFCVFYFLSHTHKIIGPASGPRASPRSCIASILGGLGGAKTKVWSGGEPKPQKGNHDLRFLLLMNDLTIHAQFKF